jgi:GTP cyclohydrolase I
MEAMTIEAIKTPVNKNDERPSREDAQAAVHTLLRYIGEDPARDGLRETPARFVRAFDEFFSGYTQDPEKMLGKTFEDLAAYDDMVLVKNIDFVAHCEHHIVPIIGKAHVAYWPDERIVGISKLARVVDVFAKRLVSQESMTGAIADTIDSVLKPKGVAVLIDANHQCMSTRGAVKLDSSTLTSKYTGLFQSDNELRRRFLDGIRGQSI